MEEVEAVFLMSAELHKMMLFRALVPVRDLEVEAVFLTSVELRGKTLFCALVPVRGLLREATPEEEVFLLCALAGAFSGPRSSNDSISS